MNRMLNFSINYLDFCETDLAWELFRNFYHKKHGTSELRQMKRLL